MVLRHGWRRCAVVLSTLTWHLGRPPSRPLLVHSRPARADAKHARAATPGTDHQRPNCPFTAISSRGDPGWATRGRRGRKQPTGRVGSSTVSGCLATREILGEVTQSVMPEPDQPHRRTASNGEPGDLPGQPANRLILRICLSKTRAGTKRRRALTRLAVVPAGYRSFGLASVAAATMTFATVAGCHRCLSSPPSLRRTSAAAVRRQG